MNFLEFCPAKFYISQLFISHISQQQNNYTAIQLQPYIAPCFGMNGHPRARTDTILRHREAPVKIYNLRASQHRFIGLNGRLQLAKGPIQKNRSNNRFLKICFGFFYRSRGSRGASGRVQNRSPSLKTSKIAIFQQFS